MTRRADGMGKSRPRFRSVGFGLALLLTSLMGCGADEEAQEVVLRWLTCEECVDGELEAVVDSLGSSATPLLREALLETPQDYLDNVERALGAAWQRRTNPAIDSAEYVDRFAANYRAVLQGRAAEALGRLGEVQILEEAYRDRGALGYRRDVVAVIEEALAEAGGGEPGFEAPVVERIIVRPDSVDVTMGGEIVLEAVSVDDEGRTLAVPIVWSISDSAIISPLGQGPSSLRVTGEALGGSTVSASSGSVTGQAILRVVPATPAPGRIVIVAGDLQEVSLSERVAFDTLRVRVEDAGGAPIAGVAVTFSVSRGADLVDGLDLSMDTDAGGEASVVLTPSAAGAGAVWVDARAVPPPGSTLRPTTVRFRLRVLP